MLDLTPILILSDIFEVLGSFLGLIMLVVWVIKQIVEANKQAGPAKGKPAAGPQPQPAAQQPQRAAPQANQQADPLRSQVEEFLRRAGRGPQGEQPAAAQRRARPIGSSEIEVLVDEGSAPPERKRLSEPFRKIEQPVSGPTPQPAVSRKPRSLRQPVTTRRESVAGHVSQNVSAPARALSEQTSRLGQRIIDDDQQFDAQLKAKFDHTVGTLTGPNPSDTELEATGSEASSVAREIALMLARPEGMRQAVILNEVLRRPIDRW